MPPVHLYASGRDFPNLARKDHLDKFEETRDSFGQKLKRSVDSWAMLYRHPAFFAVIALASTYMTVLSLDNGTLYATIFVMQSNEPNLTISPRFTPVTYGYALLQCIRESVLGGLSAVAAIVGIVGSIAFPFLRKRLNVTRSATLSLIWSVYHCHVFDPGLAWSDLHHLG